MGRKAIHDFTGYELDKPRLYTAAKKINGKLVSLNSIYVLARQFAKDAGLKVKKETVSNGIKLTFTKRGQ